MGIDFSFAWEIPFMAWLQQAMGVLALPFGTLFSALGEEYFLILILAFLYLCYDKEKGKKIAVIMIAGLLYVPLLKNAVLRRRPYMDHPEIQCLRPSERGVDPMNVAAQGFSFPSAHSMNSVTSFGSIAYYFRNRITLTAAVLMPLLIGLSRLMLGVHYPTDVLTGWVLGGLIMTLFIYLQERFSDRTLFLILLITNIPGLFICNTSDFFTCFGILLGFYAALWIDKKYVHFETSMEPLQIVLRLILIFALFLVLNTVLKLPFNKEWLEEKGTLQFLVRVIRYFLTVFLLMGVFPLSFKYLNNIKLKK